MPAAGRYAGFAVPSKNVPDRQSVAMKRADAPALARIIPTSCWLVRGAAGRARYRVRRTKRLGQQFVAGGRRVPLFPPKERLTAAACGRIPTAVEFFVSGHHLGGRNRYWPLLFFTRRRWHGFNDADARSIYFSPIDSKMLFWASRDGRRTVIWAGGSAAHDGKILA